MSSKGVKEAKILWTPTETSGLQMRKLWKRISEKYKVKIENYWDMHKWSIENLEDFWGEMWDVTGVVYSKRYEKVFDTSKKMSEHPEWFIGAKMNFAENLLRFRDNQVCLIALGEERPTEKFTYAETYKTTCRYAAAFKKLGLQVNDRVVCYISNREEAVFATLATIGSGAIWSGALPLFGANAVISRFKQIRPKFIITLDRFLNNGVEQDMLSKIKEIAASIESLEKVIIVPSNEKSRLNDISDIRNSCYLDEFLKLGENEDGTVPDMEFVQVSFNHPTFISYTSGTTGDPKALVHSSGILLSVMRDFGIHVDGTRSSCWLSMSPPGWASWNMFTTYMALGMTLVLYEGVPYFRHKTYLWDMVDEFKITNIQLTPSTLDELEKREFVPGKHNHLDSLSFVLSGGSVVKPQNFEFAYTKIKPGIVFGSCYGSSEILGCCLMVENTLPIHKGEMVAPSLGAQILVYDDEGKLIERELGNIVFANPSPAFPVCMWQDEDGELFRKTYFTRYPDAFDPGDCGKFNPDTGGFVIVGRNDDTLNQRGCRFGSSEIYNVVNTFPEVLDSLCVAQYNKQRLERAVLFLKMRPGHPFNDELVSRIRKSIADELTVRHVPEVIIEAPDIPVNMSGKKMEITVKKLIDRMPINPDSVRNKECLQFYEDHPKLQEDFN